MNPKPVTNYAELAELAGVSKATVSLALRNHPRISQKTRERVKTLAEKHGYRANPLVTAQMSAVQRGKRTTASAATIGFVAPKTVAEALKDKRTPLRFYYEGVKARANELGFTLDYIKLLPEDTTNRRLNGILAARGIRGVIFAPLTEAYPLKDFEFRWEDHSLVALENTFKSPVINSICNDEFETITRALERLERSGFKRVGMAMNEIQDSHVKHVWLAGYQAYQALISRKRRIEPFITGNWSKETFLEWFGKCKPDGIICIDDEPMEWLQEEGVSIPDEVGLASLYYLPSRPHLAGYYQNHEAMGGAAVDLISGQLYRNERGIPVEAKKVLIQSVWRDGDSIKIK
ncbi:MAG: LacI family DNA-binding transcriptional regulator [Verrucomicrobiota bacterium]